MADQYRPNRSPRPSPRPSARRSGLLRRFTRAQEGAAAVEFAFIAIPFFMLVFAIFELGVVFLVSMVMENALMTVDRKIRTGEFQTGGSNNQQAFRDAVCHEMSWLEASCQTSITLDVQVLPSFAGTAGLPRPTGQTCWNPGGAGSIVLVRGYYRWPILTPMLNSATDNSAGYREITFASVFTNEPYNSDPVPEVTCPA